MDIRVGLHLIFAIVLAWRPSNAEEKMCDSNEMSRCAQKFSSDVVESRNNNDLSAQCRVTRTYIDCTLASVAGCPEQVRAGIEQSLAHVSRRMRANKCNEDGTVEGETTTEQTTAAEPTTVQTTTKMPETMATSAEAVEEEIVIVKTAPDVVYAPPPSVGDDKSSEDMDTEPPVIEQPKSEPVPVHSTADSADKEDVDSGVVAAESKEEPKSAGLILKGSVFSVLLTVLVSIIS